MPVKEVPLPKLKFYPLTPKRWPDLAALFGPSGAMGGCWCMWWRVTRAEFERLHAAGRQRAFKKIVEATKIPPGILAYASGRPIGWCAVSPRPEYPVLDRSRVLKRVDDQPVWSITCFFVAPAYRRRGMLAALLKAAIDFAARNGATIVEGYPVEARSRHAPEFYMFTGLASAFRQAGFTEVLRRSETRPIMRYHIDPKA